MNGVWRSATGEMGRCDEMGCDQVATTVVGDRHLCIGHAQEEWVVFKSVAHLGLRPMSPKEEAAHRARAAR